MEKPFISLKVLYENLPSTSGCENCVSVNQENAFWCCKTYTPSMFYVEFLYLWKNIEQKTNDYKKNIIIRSIKNYLLDKKNKTCPFWDNECTIYKFRPFSCREYGIIPKETWNDRISYLKSIHGENYNPKEQCSLVKINKGENNKDLSNKRFKHIQQCEIGIGIDTFKVKNFTSDDSTYRVAHDHILLELFDEKFLKSLTQFKLSNPSDEEIESFIITLTKTIGTP